MKTKLILHGHFYQPPRDNPGIGKLPLQASAYPATDWNQRITDECYRANAFSRIVRFDGKVTGIRNNYEYISFNFGPTLLSWLQDHDGQTYARIIYADQKSRKLCNGHGNAIAQPYNHTILPLDSNLTRETQINWGIDDFIHHFDRYPEGLWLPEAAINQAVIDSLIAAEIKFVVLSPWQAKTLVPDSGTAVKLGSDPAPCHTVYRLEGAGGAVAVFFYEPNLASGISFGHYLRDADTLYDQLKSIGRDIPLLHTATDGEIYGHHEPYGDMCLAALIDKVKAGIDLELTNYGAYLAEHPPEGTALLKEGEERRGTSWSCAHGVSRWYKDCGCTTGGQEEWNQEWRDPLRRAFSTLQLHIERFFTEELGKMGIQDVAAALRSYSTVLTRQKTPVQFAGDLLGPVHESERISRILMLFEGMKFSQFTFTSCGWFFSDIDGIEPRQNLKYALQAVSLYRPHLSKALLDDFTGILKLAESNRKESGNAYDIYREIEAIEPGYYAVVAYGALLACTDNLLQGSIAYDYGLFQVELTHTEKHLLDYRAVEQSTLREYTGSVSYQAVEQGKIRFMDRTGKPEKVVRIGDLPKRIQFDMLETFMSRCTSRRILPELASEQLQRMLACIDAVTLQHSHDLTTCSCLIHYCLDTADQLLKKIISLRSSEAVELVGFLSRLYRYIGKNGVPRDIECLAGEILSELTHLLDGITVTAPESEKSLQLLIVLLTAVYEAELPLETTRLQETIYQWFEAPVLTASASLDSYRKVAGFVGLSEEL